MPMSEYMRGLREKVGTTVIEIPTVSVLIFDECKRALLVRHAEGNSVLGIALSGRIDRSGQERTGKATLVSGP